MPSRLLKRLALVLGGLLIAAPNEAFAQRHGGKSHGGGWHGGGSHGYQRGYGARYGGWNRYGGSAVVYGRRASVGYPAYYGYGGYGGYPGYYGYGGYYGHHHHHDNGVWIALGAGLVGVILGSALSRPYVYQYPYPTQAPPPPPAPPAAPVTPRCQDGSPVPVGGYCTGPPSEPPPMGERG